MKSRPKIKVPPVPSYDRFGCTSTFDASKPFTKAQLKAIALIAEHEKKVKAHFGPIYYEERERLREVISNAAMAWYMEVDQGEDILREACADLVSFDSSMAAYAHHTKS